MIKRSTLMGYAGLVGFAVLLYVAKTQAEEMRGEVARLERDLAETRQSVRVLEAEAVYLERFERIGAAATGGLGLEPVAPARIISLAELDAVAPLPAASPAGARAPAPAAPAVQAPPATAAATSAATSAPGPVRTEAAAPAAAQPEGPAR